MTQISVTNSQRKIPISSSSVQKVLLFVLEKSQIQCDEMAIYFVGKKKISSLHELFFNDPSPTDCITLPYDSPDSTPCIFFGEIFVCPEVAREYSDKHHTNLYEEITLYVIHGFLHLLGFKDQTPEEQKQMRAEEQKWLEKLKKANLKVLAI